MGCAGRRCGAATGISQLHSPKLSDGPDPGVWNPDPTQGMLLATEVCCRRVQSQQGFRKHEGVGLCSSGPSVSCRVTNVHETQAVTWGTQQESAKTAC